jgi:hypothetical protein
MEWYKDVRNSFLNSIAAAAWTDLKNISENIDLSIKHGITDQGWQFLTHLYNLRNGFVHGATIEFEKSNFEQIDDKVTRKYQKALKYFDKGKRENKIIDYDKLLKTQEIDLILNKKVTDVIIERAVKVIDELAELYTGTNTSSDWKKMRKA